MAQGKRPVSKRFGKGKKGATLSCKVRRNAKGKVVSAKCVTPKTKAPKRKTAKKARKDKRKPAKRSRKKK